MTTSSPKAEPCELLAGQEDSASDLLELFEELAEDLHHVPELPDAEVHLPFGPKTQQYASGVRPYCLHPDAHAAFHLRFWSAVGHCYLPFCRSCTPAKSTRAGGGGPVKGYLKAGQKLLFPQTWTKRYPVGRR